MYVCYGTEPLQKTISWAGFVMLCSENFYTLIPLSGPGDQSQPTPRLGSTSWRGKNLRSTFYGGKAMEHHYTTAQYPKCDGIHRRCRRLSECRYELSVNEDGLYLRCFGDDDGTNVWAAKMTVIRKGETIDSKYGDKAPISTSSSCIYGKRGDWGKSRTGECGASSHQMVVNFCVLLVVWLG